MSSRADTPGATSTQPELALTSREGSSPFTKRASVAESYWPHPSLLITQGTIAGKARSSPTISDNCFCCSASVSDGKKIGRAHVCTPVTNAHLVCRLLLEKKNDHNLHQKHNKTR